MNKLLKRIRIFLCKHDKKVYYTEIYVKPKYKNVKKGCHKLRYDVWEKYFCHKYGKFLYKVKIKSNLTEVQAELYMQKYL